MKLVTFDPGHGPRLGALARNWVIDLTLAWEALLVEQGTMDATDRAQQELPSDMLCFLRHPEAMERAQDALRFVARIAANPSTKGPQGAPFVFESEKVKLLAPLPNPTKLGCIGRNYADHCREQGVELPDSPILFAKFNSSIIGPGDPIQLPAISDLVDFEVELAFVIGRQGKRISEQEALDYVAGYTIINDISARDLQRIDRQYTRAKSLDTFAPMGPVLVTKDEIPDPNSLGIRLELNGELMQDSNTSEMVFSIPYLISFISQEITLYPGDVFATGTPAGVGFTRQPPVLLKHGDQIAVEIDGIGRMENPVIGS
jgi:acylpyruvate hydrolase